MSIVELPPGPSQEEEIHDMSMSLCTVRLGQRKKTSRDGKPGQILAETTVCDTFTKTFSDLHAVLLAEYDNKSVVHLSKYSLDGHTYGEEGSVGHIRGIIHGDFPAFKLVVKTPKLELEEPDEKIRKADDEFTFKTFLTERRCHQLINTKVPDDGKRRHVLKLLDSFVDSELMPAMVFQRASACLHRMIRTWERYPSLVQQPIVRLGWLRQLLQGLVTLHRDCGIIHGDLKSSNILMFHSDNEVELRICDFGTAIQVGTEAAYDPQYQVTRWFRPPEVAFYLREYTTALDMFSLACVYLDMVHDESEEERFLHTTSYVEHAITLMYLLAPQIERHPETYPYYLERVSSASSDKAFRDLTAKYRQVDKDSGETHAWDRVMWAIERQSIPLCDFEKHLLYDWLQLDPRRRLSAEASLARVDEMLVYLKQQQAQQVSSTDLHPVPPEQPQENHPPALPHTVGDPKPCLAG